LPLTIALGIASGARPKQGLYQAVIDGLVVSRLGGRRVPIARPIGTFIAIIPGSTAKYCVAGLLAATSMAGYMLVLMGLAKLGGVIKFIPAPVIVGFTSGIGVISFVSHWHRASLRPGQYARGDHRGRDVDRRVTVDQKQGRQG